MDRGRSLWRWGVLALVALAELAAVLALSMAFTGTSSAQFFDDRFPFLDRRRQQQQRQQQYQQNYQNPFQQQQGGFGGFFSPAPEQRPAAPPVDYSHAPPPRKADTAKTDQAQTSIVVFGDSMADWLAYGLETAYTDAPEMAIVRKHRTQSGLIRQDVRHDPRGEYPDWPRLTRETLATMKPDFIVMMIGLNDRRSIRDVRPPPRPAAKPGQPAQPGQQPNETAEQKPDAKPEQPKPEAKADPKQPVDDEQGPPEPAPAAEAQPTGGTYEFRTEKWDETYVKRIDETIAALKSKGVPVLWVGLPPIRGTRSTADASYLNDLYRSRADKAGIIYVDVWDGFVDDGGRFTMQGPDFEGQTRRLRAGDGVHFTQAGARKMAHYVDRELQRWLSARVTPVALPAPEEPAPKAPEPAKPGSAPGAARPMSGPVVPLSTASTADGDELMGGTKRQESAADVVATKVLVKGEPLPAPAGRADDFAWPRRGVAPVGTDPVVALTTIPMTPFKGERPQQTASASPAGGAAAGPPQPGAVRPAQRPRPQTQAQYRPEPRRPQPFFFPFLFGR